MSPRIRHRRFLVGAALCSAFVLAPSPTHAQAVMADPSDVESPEAIVLATYASIERAPGEDFDWDRFRSLFLPTATLIPNTEQRGGNFTPMSVQGFIDWIDAATQVGGANDLGFAEEQVSSRTERYGDIAQVFSTYRKHYWDDDQILGRGINSFLLVRNGERWWVAAIAWDEETGAGTIPSRYLSGGRR